LINKLSRKNNHFFKYFKRPIGNINKENDSKYIKDKAKFPQVKVNKGNHTYSNNNIKKSLRFKTEIFRKIQIS